MENIIYCEGCLYSNRNTVFYEYYIHNETLQAAVNKSKLILCFICRKIALKVDLFISNILKAKKYFNIKVTSKISEGEDSFKAIVSLNKTCIEFIEVGIENSAIETSYAHIRNSGGSEKHTVQSNVYDYFDASIHVNLKAEDISEHIYDDEVIEASRLDIIVKDENVQEKSNCHFVEDDNVLNQNGKLVRNKKSLLPINQIDSGSYDVSMCFKKENKPNYVFQDETKKTRQVEIKNENTKDDSSCMGLNRFKASGKPAVKLKKRTRKHLAKNIKASSLSTEEYCQVIYLTEEQCIEERTKMLSQNKYLKAPYKCEDCVKGYVYRESYEKHMVSHSEKSGNYECNICKQKRKTKNLLLKHRTLHFRQYSCKLCKYTRLSPVSIDEHYNATHSSHLLYECSFCDKKYWKRTLLKKHIAYKHSECTRVACDLCGKTYVNAYSLRTHVHTVHASETDTPPVRKEHVCTHCGAAFKHASLLRAHSVKHTDSKLFYCVECDKSFKSESTLRQHLRLAAPHVNCDVLPYPCGDCGEKFASARSRAAHRNKVHLHSKPFQCTMCDKAYHSGWALAGHTKYSHETQERKHACTYCDKKFKRKYVLLHHIRTHTGERPHRCRLCPAAFAQSSVLWRHMRTVHTDSRRAGGARTDGDVDDNK